jgi:two-component system chemotaxis response regulator CheY
MGKQALVCDDALFMRSMLSKILRGAGYEVVAEAKTGVEALAKFREHQPDLVTMDIVMPEMDGLEAVRRIVEEFPDARVVMCSAIGQEPLVAEAMRSGARAHVMKPFHPARVLEAIERVTR